MAATYTEVSLEDLERFLKRAFRALRPKQSVKNGEYCYDLFLSANVAIRVWTSVRHGASSGADVGQDAIRVQLVGVKSQRPLTTGKAPIVKRTQNWRNSLQNRIEEWMETYEDKQEYWESRGGASPEASQPATQSGPSEAQLRYLGFLLQRMSEQMWHEHGFATMTGLQRVPTREVLQRMSASLASRLIGALKDAGYGQQGRRYADDGYSYDFSET